jgi:hypothetical protein
MDESNQSNMKEHEITYHPNGSIKHEIVFHDNGSKKHEIYLINGKWHNISNPASTWFNKYGKNITKYYYINDNYLVNKLNWMNLIKNI